VQNVLQFYGREWTTMLLGS